MAVVRGILVRLSPDQAQEVRQGAAREAMSLQAFCAQAVLRAARGDGHDLLVEIHAAVCARENRTNPTNPTNSPSRLDEAVAALTVLGMQAPEARRRAERALRTLPPNADTAAVVVAVSQAGAARLHKEL